MNPLTLSEQRLLYYVQEYMRYADLFCTTLRTTFDLDFTQVLRTQRNTVMGQSGKVKGIAYSFHGRGCGFKTKEIKLELDFDSLGRWNCVDLWRLRLFIEENTLDTTWSESQLEEEVSALLQKHYLYQVDREGDYHFFYLNVFS